MGVTVALAGARRDGAGRGRCGRKTEAGRVGVEGAAGGDGDGARLRPAARRSASRRTCGRRRRSAATSICRTTSLSRSSRSANDVTDRQQHRPAQRRGVHAAGNRRRSLPLERGVPDAVAPEADRGQRRPRRHVARSALRAEVRPGHADSVDAAVDRERRPGGRLHLRLLLHLHRHDQLGVADAAAADGARPARRVRSAVRRRRDAGRARRQPPRRQEHSRLGDEPDLDAAERDRFERSQRGSTNTSTTSARSSGGFSVSKRATPAANRARSPKRRSACPTRSKSTSTS